MATARFRSGFSYALDSARRLVITQPGARRAGLAPVRVAEGRVITDRGHRIVYELERPLDPAGPSRVAFDGMWRMSPEHAVEFTGQRTDGPRGGFTLAGSVVTARARALIISLAGEGRAAPVLSLAGRWQVDAANRLSFLVDRGGRTDRLTFRGAWQLGPDHELAYQYREALEGRRGVRVRTLRFDGAWALGPGGRLRYSLEGSDDQALELRGSLEPARIEASGGKLGFRVGARRFTLSGQWKLHPDRTVSFEIPVSGGRR
ncbi:MAG: hypothetical protein Q8S13_02510, partial [Dehalococcoidia bacterium]|nr:hypothetical protein [Dehalococcoidia bacterium]